MAQENNMKDVVWPIQNMMLILIDMWCHLKLFIYVKKKQTSVCLSLKQSHQ